jgi:hypothetical protein
VNVTELELVIALATGLAVLGWTTWSRRLESRRRSITRPLYELRGAMTALELGLDRGGARRSARMPDIGRG